MQIRVGSALIRVITTCRFSTVRITTMAISGRIRNLTGPLRAFLERMAGAALTSRGLTCDCLVGEGYNHFEILETLANPCGLLGRAVLRQMG